MESIFVMVFLFTSIVSSIAYFVELHIRINKEQELDDLSNMDDSDFHKWKEYKNGNRTD